MTQMHLLVSFVSLSSVRAARMSSKGGGFDTVLDERGLELGTESHYQISKGLTNFFCRSIAASGDGMRLV